MLSVQILPNSMGATFSKPDHLQVHDWSEPDVVSLARWELMVLAKMAVNRVVKRHADERMLDVMFRR